MPRIILVSSGDELMPRLCRALDPCPLEIRSLKSCREAGHEIGRCATADVIFTDIRLADGDWRQVLHMARRTPARSEVIVVSKFVDVRLYLDALGAGVFDFVVPPFRTVELGYLIVNAIYACFKQRSHRFSGNFADATPRLRWGTTAAARMFKRFRRRRRGWPIRLLLTAVGGKFERL